MLILRTGVPGAGKTLNTIKDIDQEYGYDPKKPDQELRTIYYYNIPELDTDKLTANWVQFSDPENWYNYPDGSMFVIDEAQEIFPNDGKKDRPLKISKMERHRHHGHDIVLITQHPTLISPHVRKLVGKHIHIHRPFGGKRLRRFEYEFCIDEPQRATNFSLAQIHNSKLDKKYFGVYKSATQHTHKFKMPKIYYVGIIAIIVVVLFVLLTIYSLNGMTEEEAAKQAEALFNESPSQTSKVLSGDVIGDKSPKTLEQYINENTPRIADIPASAPRYDDINKPTIIPKPTCIMSTDPNRLETAERDGYRIGVVNNKMLICQCYTQQGTRLDISLNGCYNYVTNGYFDDTRYSYNQAPQSAAQPSTRGVERNQGYKLF